MRCAQAALRLSVPRRAAPARLTPRVRCASGGGGVVCVAAPHPAVVDVLWDLGPPLEPWEVVLESLVGMSGKNAGSLRRRIRSSSP